MDESCPSPDASTALPRQGPQSQRIGIGDPPPALESDGERLRVHPESLGKPVNLRRWFALFVLWLIALTVAARLGMAYHHGGDLSRRLWLLACLAFYLSLACTFLPIPTTPVIALAAIPDLGLAHGLWPRVILIAAVGALGTTMANLNDYHLWTYVLRHRKVAAIRHTRLYRTAIRWFSRSAGWTLVAFSFIPIPVDVVRLLAITFQYPRWRFATANYVGRFVRYAILVWAVASLSEIPGAQWWVVLGVTVLTVGAGLTVGLPWLIRLIRPTRAIHGHL